MASLSPFTVYYITPLQYYQIKQWWCLSETLFGTVCCLKSGCVLSESCDGQNLVQHFTFGHHAKPLNRKTEYRYRLKDLYYIQGAVLKIPKLFEVELVLRFDCEKKYIHFLGSNETFF